MKKPVVVEVLVLVSIFTLEVSCVLLDLLREIASERGEEVTFPPERLARVFQLVTPLLTNCVARYLGYDPPDLL